jgi:hypothetical protein
MYGSPRWIRLMPLLLFFSLSAAPAAAGPEKVLFPQYQNFVLYLALDRPDIKEVRDLYASPNAINVQPGQPLPSGATLVMVHFKAQLSGNGELLKDTNGRLVRGSLDRIGVMEKRTGWGAEYSDEMRNGEWEYALFRPDGTRNEQAKIAACFGCHKPNSRNDFMFSFEKLLATGKR